MNFSKGKWKVIAIAFALFVALYVANFIFSKFTASSSPSGNTDAKPHVTYQSSTMRMLPCGRMKRNTVEVENGQGVKTAQLIDVDGKTVLSEKKYAVDTDQSGAIQAGQFVPDLWKGCQCPCSCPMCHAV